MSQRLIGIDLLQSTAQVVVARSDAPLHEVDYPRIPPTLPAVALPHKKGEPPLAGPGALRHRRGMGLSWPPEAQFREPDAGGCGRVPLLAAWERLGGAGEWGSNEALNKPFRWVPPGSETAIGILPAATIALSAVGHGIAARGDALALVVPDRLEDDALDALSRQLARGWHAARRAPNLDTTHLLWRSTALALGWCERHADAFSHRTPGVGSPEIVGRIAVASFGMDLFELTVVPIGLLLHEGERLLVPVVDRSLGDRRLGPHGMTVQSLLSRAESPEELWRELVAGQRPTAPPRPRLDAEINGSLRAGGLTPGQLGPAAAGTVRERLAFVFEPDDQSKAYPEDLFPSEANWYSQWFFGLLDLQGVNPQNRLSGAVVHGSAAVLSPSGGRTYGTRAQKWLERAGAATRRIDGAECTAAAAAASTFLWRRARGIPTYFERLVPISIYTIKKNDRGDKVDNWVNLMPEGLIPGGEAHEAPHPIEGLTIQEGADSLALTLRRGRPHRTNDQGRSLPYRKVSAPLEEAAAQREDVKLNVRVRPGQGYAEVTVFSVTPGVFSAHLDWETMKPAERPGVVAQYIGNTWTLRSDWTRWSSARESFEEVTEALWMLASKGTSQRRVRATYNLLKKLRENHFTRRDTTDQAYEYEALMTLSGDVPHGGASQSVASFRDALARVFTTCSSVSDEFRHELIRSAGWQYAAIPDPIRDDVLQRLRAYSRAPTASISDSILTAAGCGLTEAADIRLFMQAFTAKLRHSPSETNNWLRALRYLVQYREHTLSLQSAPDQALRHITEHITTTLGRQHRAKNYEFIFKNCLHSLVFLLKRRRYDPGFLSEQTESTWQSAAFTSLQTTLQEVIARQAERGGLDAAGLRPDEHALAELALAFLEMRSTEADLKKLIELVSDAKA